MTKMEQLRSRLDGVTRELTDSGGLMVLDQPDRVKKAMEKVVSRIRYAPHGYSAFFDAVKVDEKALEGMYDFDVALTERIEELEITLNTLEASVSDHAELKNQVNQALKLLRDFDEHLDKRGKLMAGDSEGGEKPSLFSSLLIKPYRLPYLR